MLQELENGAMTDSNKTSGATNEAPKTPKNHDKSSHNEEEMEDEKDTDIKYTNEREYDSKKENIPQQVMLMRTKI